jgi:hypothetical protein
MILASHEKKMAVRSEAQQSRLVYTDGRRIGRQLLEKEHRIENACLLRVMCLFIFAIGMDTMMVWTVDTNTVKPLPTKARSNKVRILLIDRWAQRIAINNISSLPMPIVVQHSQPIHKE